jgi:hypothetical protein
MMNIIINDMYFYEMLTLVVKNFNISCFLCLVLHAYISVHNVSNIILENLKRFLIKSTFYLKNNNFYNLFVNLYVFSIRK